MIKNYIRPIAVAVIKKQDKTLCCSYHDKVKNQSFCRLIGGEIEFQEKAEDALIREFKEELGLDIKIGNLLKVVESIFEYENYPGHEICFVYEAEFANPNIYNQEKISVIEAGKENQVATWADPKKDTIYPINPKDL